MAQAPPPSAPYIRTSTWTGVKRGYVFSKGDLGIGYYKDETDFCWDQCTECLDEFGEFIDWDRYWESRYERDGYTAFSVPNGMAFFRPV